MIGQNPSRIEFPDRSDGFGKAIWAGIEASGWESCLSEVAGKEISSEEEIMSFAVETAMACGVAGQRNDLKAAPKI